MAAPDSGKEAPQADLPSHHAGPAAASVPDGAQEAAQPAGGTVQGAAGGAADARANDAGGTLLAPAAVNGAVMQERGREAADGDKRHESEGRGRHSSRRRSRDRHSRSRSPEHGHKQRISRSRSRGSHSPSPRHRSQHSRSRSGERRRRSRSRSRSRTRTRSLSGSDSERRRHHKKHKHQHKKHSHHHKDKHRSHHRSHDHSHRKRSRSTSAPPRHKHEARAAAEGANVLQSDGSGGASSLGRLSLQQRQQGEPSPGVAAAAAALMPPAAAMGRPGGPSPAGHSPLGPASLLRVQTPSAAALAAAEGIDLSDVALVQPSPMAAEATVAALSALMHQPPRPPQLLHPHAHAHKRAAAPDKGKGQPLLSFGDELVEEDDGSEGAAPGSAPGRPSLSATTAKRFKHEKTLVMLNPHLGPDAQHHLLYPSLEDEEEIPCSPAAQLDRRLGQFMWGSARAKGMRPYMEDRHTVIGTFHPRTSSGQTIQDGVFRAYAAVFDGHNGASAAEHVADRLHHVLAAEAALRTCTGEGPPATAAREEERIGAALVHSFEAVDREIMTRCRLEGTKGGATGLVVLRIGNQLYAAHCGDTRAVMSRNGEALRLTEDHKPNLPRERKRVEGLGGRVDFARCWRVIVDPGNGRPASGLAVSRSFGDPDFKEPLHLVTATPDVIRERLLPGDDFVILASDGLWDVLSDTEACAVVRRHLQQAGAPRQITPPQLLPGAAAFGGAGFADQMRRPPQLSAALATSAAERLVQESLARGTMDNVTAVVGLLQWD